MSRLTLARILARCEGDGDCLIWTGKHNGKGQPMAMERIDGKDKTVTVRRRAYEEYHGVTLTRSQQVTTCGHPGCLARNHLEAISLSEKMRRTHAGMAADERLRRSKSLAAAFQAATGKITPEQVRAIKDSEDGPYVTAKRLGVNGTVASRIKRGLSYKEYTANPFSGLGA